MSLSVGVPYDHPVTDTVVHGRHPFPKGVEWIVIAVHARNPGVFHGLLSGPFDWAKGRFLPETTRLLQGLLDHHGDPAACRRVLDAGLPRELGDKDRTFACLRLQVRFSDSR